MYWFILVEIWWGELLTSHKDVEVNTDEAQTPHPGSHHDSETRTDSLTRWDYLSRHQPPPIASVRGGCCLLTRSYLIRSRDRKLCIVVSEYRWRWQQWNNCLKYVMNLMWIVYKLCVNKSRRLFETDITRLSKMKRFLILLFFVRVKLIIYLNWILQTLLRKICLQQKLRCTYFTILKF